MYNSNIKIPAKHYVGMVKRSTAKIPLGFITPWGEDAAAKKRMSTVDSWANQRYHGNIALPAMVIENMPMGGFKMTSDIRSTSYGGSDKWRIEDPRGFELEITSENLAQLLSVGMIDRGEIVDTCVWARNGQSNVLLSTSTDEYKSAVENTEVSEMKADWKDVKIGNTVLLQNNVTGVWLGRMHGVYVETGYNEDSERNQLRVTDKTTHVIYINEASEAYKHKLLLVNTPKLAAITSAETMTDAESEVLVNNLINDSTCNVEQAGYKTYIALVLGAPKLGKTATLSLKPIQIESVEVLEQKTYYRGKMAVYMNPGSIYLYKLSSSKNYGKNAVEFKCNAYSLGHFNNHGLIPVGDMVEQKRGYWSSSYSRSWVQKSHNYEFKSTDEFYTVKLTIDTKAGNSIEAYVR